MKIKKYLPIIGIAIFLYILIRLDISIILSEMFKINLIFLLASFFLLFLLMITQTTKWFVIAKAQKIGVPFLESFKINLITNFYGSITPSRLGTLIRAEYLKKYTNKFGKGLSNFIIDKVLDIISLLLISIVFSFIIINQLGLVLTLNLLFFLLILSFLSIIFMDKRKSKFLLRWIYRILIPKKMKEKAKTTFEEFYEDMPKKKYFLLFFLTNLINWFIVYLIVFLIALGLGINLPFIIFLALYPLGTLSTMIPITIAGLGTREAVLISLFSIFNISAEKVFSLSLLVFIITIIIPAIIGAILIFVNKKS